MNKELRKLSHLSRERLTSNDNKSIYTLLAAYKKFHIFEVMKVPAYAMGVVAGINHMKSAQE